MISAKEIADISKKSQLLIKKMIDSCWVLLTHLHLIGFKADRIQDKTKVSVKTIFMFMN